MKKLLSNSFIFLLIVAFGSCSDNSKKDANGATTSSQVIESDTSIKLLNIPLKFYNARLPNIDSANDLIERYTRHLRGSQVYTSPSPGAQGRTLESLMQANFCNNCPSDQRHFSYFIKSSTLRELLSSGVDSIQIYPAKKTNNDLTLVIVGIKQRRQMQNQIWDYIDPCRPCPKITSQPLESMPAPTR